MTLKTTELEPATEIFDETGASLVDRIEAFTAATSAVFHHPATAFLGLQFVAQSCLAGLGARRAEAQAKFAAKTMASRLN